MSVLGNGFTTARVLAVALGIASVLLVRTSARWLTKDDTVAFVAGLIACVIPWSVRLGVSVVPELPSAACSLLAVASLAPGPPHRKILGALALAAAAFCRYEPWFIAVGFAGWIVLQTLFAWRRGEPPHWAIHGIAALIPFVGPIAWIAWNQKAHGSPLWFLQTVSQYRDAVDGGALFERVFGYVKAAFRAEPELIALLGYGVFTWHRDPRREQRLFSPFVAPAAVLGFMFLMLTISSIRGGAPTHHPERALLAIHLTVVVAAAAAVVHAHRRGTLAPPKKLAIAIVALAPFDYMLRYWYLYREGYAHREPELALGEEVARAVPPEERILIQVTDYAFYSIEVGARRPWSFIESHEVDPAKGAEDVPFERLVEQARGAGAAFVLAHGAPVEGRAPVLCREGWCLYGL